MKWNEILACIIVICGVLFWIWGIVASIIDSVRDGLEEGNLKAQLLTLGKLALFHWVPAISAIYLFKYDHPILGLTLLSLSLVAGVHIFKNN